MSTFNFSDEQTKWLIDILENWTAPAGELNAQMYLSILYVLKDRTLAGVASHQGHILPCCEHWGKPDGTILKNEKDPRDLPGYQPPPYSPYANSKF